MNLGKIVGVYQFVTMEGEAPIEESPVVPGEAPETVEEPVVPAEPELEPLPA